MKQIIKLKGKIVKMDAKKRQFLRKLENAGYTVEIIIES